MSHTGSVPLASRMGEIQEQIDDITERIVTLERYEHTWRKKFEEHEDVDTRRHDENVAKLNELLRGKAQLMGMVLLIGFVGLAGILGGAKWVLKQAIQEILLEHKIVRIERAP